MVWIVASACVHKIKIKPPSSESRLNNQIQIGSRSRAAFSPTFYWQCQKFAFASRVGNARAWSAKQISSLLAATDPHISRLAEFTLFRTFGLCFCMLRWCLINTVAAAQLYLPAAQKLLCDIATVRKSLAMRTGRAAHRMYQWFWSLSMLPARPCIAAIPIVSKISRSQFRSRNFKRYSYYMDFRFLLTTP